MPKTTTQGDTPDSVPAPVYQLRIDLRHLKPPIWRRVLVPGGITLYKLHQIIQVVMPWADYHLYEFSSGGERFGDPSDDDWEPSRSARRYRLNQMVSEGQKLAYVYDFGDYWEHEIKVEKVLPAEPGVRYPVCIAGKRACPPEDCGGPWGYPDLLAALADPKHEEHDSMLEWVGGEFDSEAFDLESINAGLRAIKVKT
ncbi:MAG: hypothetical protein CVU38_03220 [Chloroflexi bacterium HGW-Chloroflexi-1]|nr:MAG: hypothetical protein CVU38_03220 [Chloroflexi bacterium HGW-Chloroflexi-1]